MSEFAVASADGRISLWCDRRGRDELTPEGGICGWVINGQWTARFDAFGRGVGDAKGGRIVWRGAVPRKYSYDYNEAIYWLTETQGTWWRRLKYRSTHLPLFLSELPTRMKRAWRAFSAPLKCADEYEDEIPF